MSKIGRQVTVVGIALCAVGSLARAQTVPSAEHPVRIGLGGGASVPIGDAGDAYQTGVHGQGFLLIHLGGLPSIRLNLGYQKFDFKNAIPGATGGAPAGLQDAESTILSGVAALQLHLLKAGPVRPYLLAGLGAFRVKNSVDTAGTANSASSASTSSVKFGIDGGAGLAIKLGRVDAYIEGKVQNVYTNEGVIDTKSIRVIPISFGIIF